MIAPKHTDKSRDILEVEKKFTTTGRGVFVVTSLLHESQIPPCNELPVLTDLQVTKLNSKALEYQLVRDQ